MRSWRWWWAYNALSPINTLLWSWSDPLQIIRGYKCFVSAEVVQKLKETATALKYVLLTYSYITTTTKLRCIKLGPFYYAHEMIQWQGMIHWRLKQFGMEDSLSSFFTYISDTSSEMKEWAQLQMLIGEIYMMRSAWTC